jgi:hypothetical protein
MKISSFYPFTFILSPYIAEIMACHWRAVHRHTSVIICISMVVTIIVPFIVVLEACFCEVILTNGFVCVTEGLGINF